MSVYSICIPRVFSNITWKRVKTVFDQLTLGEIDRVDMVERMTDDGTAYKRVFIHFKSWYDSENATAVRNQLDAEGGEIKIVYDDPWYWKCFKSRVARPEQAPTSKQRRVPTIELDGGKIIRGAQRAGTRKVHGRRQHSHRSNQSQRGQPWKERNPAQTGSGEGSEPATSVAADEFLASLSVSEDAAATTGPTTPPGSPNHPPLVSAMSPTATVTELSK